MELHHLPREIYKTNIRLLADTPFTSDAYGGFNREIVVHDRHITLAAHGIKHLALIGAISGVTIMQTYEHATIKPGAAMINERNQTTVLIKGIQQETFYEFEKNGMNQIETRKLLYKDASRDVQQPLVGFELPNGSEHAVPYNSYEWVTTHTELIALSGLTRAILQQRNK